MDTQQERLSRLNHALLSGEDVCSSEGMLHDFPESLKKPFQWSRAGGLPSGKFYVYSESEGFFGQSE